MLAAIFGFDALHTRIAEAKALGQPPTPVVMPGHIGNFSLVRTWNDTLFGGTIVYTWGDYAQDAAPAGTTPLHVAFGISPVFGVHDAEVCHIARGEDPTWHGQIAAKSPGGEVDLTAATYNNGVTQRLEASTVCDGGVCKQFSQTSQHVTLVYAHPHAVLPMQQDPSRAIPVLLKVETTDTVTSGATMRPILTAALTSFLAQADLAGLTQPYSRH